jgi:hypothetical protein
MADFVTVIVFVATDELVPFPTVRLIVKTPDNENLKTTLESLSRDTTMAPLFGGRDHLKNVGEPLVFAAKKIFEPLQL